MSRLGRRSEDVFGDCGGWADVARRRGLGTGEWSNRELGIRFSRCFVLFHFDGYFFFNVSCVGLFADSWSSVKVVGFVLF
jgi:hypothetical protein